MIAIIGTSDRPCWLAEACKILLLLILLHELCAGRYQHYLESVLEGADEFHEIGDLILRHATLAATNQDLKEQRNHFGEAAEQTRSHSHSACLCGPLLAISV